MSGQEFSKFQEPTARAVVVKKRGQQSKIHGLYKKSKLEIG
jgi:hypothetical protein